MGVAKALDPIDLFNKHRMKYREIGFTPTGLCLPKAPARVCLNVARASGVTDDWPAFIPTMNLEEGPGFEFRYDPGKRTPPERQLVTAITAVVEARLAGRRFFVDPDPEMTSYTFSSLAMHGPRAYRPIPVRLSIEGEPVPGLDLGLPDADWKFFVPWVTDEGQEIDKALRAAQQALHSHIR